jgi:hypothetical protein
MRSIKKALACALVFTTVLLSGCKQPSPPQECPKPPVIDGHFTVELEGGKGKLRLPESFAPTMTADCKYMQSLHLFYQWRDGKLVSRWPPSIAESPNDYVHVPLWIGPAAGKPNPNVKPFEAWQFEPALPHNKYPLVLYPRAYWSAPDKPSPATETRSLWGVKGTTDPTTGRPYLVGCNLLPSVSSEFSPDHGAARCGGGIRITTGKTDLAVDTLISAKDVPQIDRIFNAMEARAKTFIEE